ncbi:MAG TPA: homoserine O-succinyltransferase [Steroidobacteraceae bacterium]
MLSTSTSAPAPENAVSAASPVREGILPIPGTLQLHFGGKLENVRVAWRLVGKHGPIVAALGGISAGRYVTGAEPKGWWSEIVGPGGALDTDRFQVLGFDYLGGSGETTGPRPGQSDFPSISAYDQALVLRLLLDHLKIDKLAAIIGASYGAMVALAFGQREPDRVEQLIAISGADRAHPMSTAWRSVQRAIVRYAISKGEGAEGLRLARALAMATYRSPQEFVVRFSGPPREVDGRFQFPVEGYLLSRGDAYASSYVPEAFICLSESIDLHQVDATQIRVPTTLVAVREDQLVPLADMQALAQRLAGPAKLVEVSSLYGHDAFLKEADALRSIFRAALEEDR